MNEYEWETKNIKKDDDDNNNGVEVEVEEPEWICVDLCLLHTCVT